MPRFTRTNLKPDSLVLTAKGDKALTDLYNPSERDCEPRYVALKHIMRAAAFHIGQGKPFKKKDLVERAKKTVPSSSKIAQASLNEAVDEAVKTKWLTLRT